MQVVIFTEVCHGGFGRYAGTYRIATELRERGLSVQVVEFFTKWTYEEIKEIIDKFVDYQTLLVGFSCTFLIKDGEQKERIQKNAARSKLMDVSETYNVMNAAFGRDDVFDIIDYIRSNSNAKIAVGGAKSTTLRGNEDMQSNVDYIVTGQADASIHKIMDHIIFGKELNCDERLPRIAKVVDQSHYPVDNFTTSRIRFHESDLIFPKEHLPMEIARGCIFKCAFCSYPLLNKKLWEFNRQPKIIADDLREANFKYGSTGFMFADDTYNDSIDKVEQLHKEFTNLPFELEFSTYARADLLVTKPHSAELLYESGMRSVFFGIESLNHKSGKTIGKGMDPEKLKDGLYKAKSTYGWNDIITTSGFILGLPYETEESLMKTFEWLQTEDCPLDSYSPSPLRISKNSSIGQNMERYGYKFNKNGKWESPWLSEERAEEMAREWYKGFNKKKRTRFQFTFFNRMQNLGWTLKDFDEGKWSIEESARRKDVLKDKYYSGIMTL
tara:strand:+ start:2390 stop:3883 length:1494 start_codon:yes stop_codon:yes gene_type:complete